jgi:hypothetical protein
VTLDDHGADAALTELDRETHPHRTAADDRDIDLRRIPSIARHRRFSPSCT